MDLNKNQVIAVDFDGTLCKQAWPEIGEANEALILHLKKKEGRGRKTNIVDEPRRRFTGRSSGMVQGTGIGI